MVSLRCQLLYVTAVEVDHIDQVNRYLGDWLTIFLGCSFQQNYMPRTALCRCNQNFPLPNLASITSEAVYIRAPRLLASRLFSSAFMASQSCCAKCDVKLSRSDLRPKLSYLSRAIAQVLKHLPDPSLGLGQLHRLD